MIPPTAFMQACWIVPDLERAMRRWHETVGVGPFFVNAHVVTQGTRYRGQPTSFDHSLALAQAGDLQIELIEQHSEVPSVYRDSVPKGAEGFHHMACFVDDIAAEFARYERMGAPIAYEGKFGAMRFGYADTRAQLGFMIEMLEHEPGIDSLFGHIANAAMNWDGRDPIRPFPTFE